MSSRIPGFYKLTMDERLAKVVELTGLSEEKTSAIAQMGSLPKDQANRMIENVIGSTEFPLAVATNFIVNGTEKLIPMAIEEPSVVAAASNAARMTRSSGGFRAEGGEPVMIGQIQICDVPDPNAKSVEILAHKEEIIGMANEQDPMLVGAGGGAKDLECRVLDSITGKMLVVHLLVDTRDAMGANAVNTMAEAAAPYLEEITGGRVFLRIISNLATERLTRAWATFPKEELGGEEVVDAIIKAYAFADADPFRCATHNKGIMNGISAVALATMNDTRALEAGAHAYAAMGGRYKPLTRWEKNGEGDLVGSIEIPLAVGLFAATAVHPVAKAAVSILGIETAQELSKIMACVGLAQNLAAIRALATEGIQRGHMSLHARNIAILAGAGEAEIDDLAAKLASEGKVRLDRAKELLGEMRSGSQDR
ncbi:MAG: hydroxymethylglutaryl-CoA reductase, degradative [Theionarchaea archaeon]|nr:hydroxymethylglutaryl-CoA reductase, degradative [Theionarchaea archaeon]